MIKTEEITKISNLTESMLDQTNLTIKTFIHLGAEVPQVVTETQKDHKIILAECRKENPSIDRIEMVRKRIEKRLNDKS